MDDRDQKISTAAMPARWSAAPSSGSAAEQKAALLFRAAARLEARGRVDLAALHFRLRRSWRKHDGRIPARGVAGLRRVRLLVATAALVLASSFVAAASWWRRRPDPAATTPPPATAPRVMAPPSGQGRELGWPAPEETAAAAVSVAVTDGDASRASLPWVVAGEVQGGGGRAPGPRRPGTRPAVVASAQSLDAAAGTGAVPPRSYHSDDTAEQAAMLTKALTLLRRDRDAPAAIDALLAYRTRFPRGLFTDEASAALVESYLAAQRAAEALAVLEREPPLSGERGRAQITLRGELRARAGRCAAALPDFDAVITREIAGNLAERALYGRAVCHLDLGHTAEARQDFAAYAQRFPSGRFVEDARKRLQR